MQTGKKTDFFTGRGGVLSRGSEHFENGRRSINQALNEDEG